jgi:hypothetical protein
VKEKEVWLNLGVMMWQLRRGVGKALVGKEAWKQCP